MDVGDLALLRNQVMNLSNTSPVTEWARIVRILGDMYKVDLAKVLTGATTPTLATERGDAETDIAALVTELNINTNT